MEQDALTRLKDNLEKSAINENSLVKIQLELFNRQRQKLAKEKGQEIKEYLEGKSFYYNQKASNYEYEISEAVNLFTNWKNNTQYEKDVRVNYNGVLYKCLQSHTSQEAWTPTDAPSLWAKVLIPDPNIIPEWEQPDSTNPYMKGDKVMFEGKVYESTIDNNVWRPDSYGWELV